MNPSRQIHRRRIPSSGVNLICAITLFLPSVELGAQVLVDFDEETFADTGWLATQAGNFPLAEVSTATVPPDEEGREWSNGRGLRVHLKTSQGVFLLGPRVLVGEGPVLAVVSIRSDSPDVNVFMGAFDGSAIGDLGLHQQIQGELVEGKWVRFRAVIQPASSAVFPFLQVVKAAGKPGPANVYIDRFSVISLTDNMVPSSLQTQFIREALTLDPPAPDFMPPQERVRIDFDADSLVDLGIFEVPASGYELGESVLREFDENERLTFGDGKGLSITVKPGEGTLMYFPYVASQERPVIIRVSIRASGHGAWVFLGGLNAVRTNTSTEFDGSAGLVDSMQTEVFAENDARLICFYRPHGTGVVPLLQIVHSGEPGLGEVTVNIDNVEIIPVTDEELPTLPDVADVREMLGLDEEFNIPHTPTPIPGVPRIDLIDPPRDTEDTLGPYTVNARVFDDDGIELVLLYYSVNGGQSFNSVQMDLLGELQRLSGQITDALTGEPVPGAEVTMYWSSSASQGLILYLETDTTGSYSTQLLEGDWRIIVRKQGYEAFEAEVTVRSGEVINEQDITLPPTTPATKRNTSHITKAFALPTGETVDVPIAAVYSGDIPGQPAGTEIRYYIEAVNTSQKFGRFPQGAPDDYRSFFVTQAVTPTPTPTLEPGQPTPTATDTPVVVPTIPAGIISGIVLDSRSQQGIAGVQVEAHIVEEVPLDEYAAKKGVLRHSKMGVWHGGGPWGPVHRLKTVAKTVVTDDRGQFEFPIDSKGIYSLDFRAAGYSEAQRRAEIIRGEYIAVDPVLLTPIEVLENVDGDEGGIVANKSGTLSLEIQAGQFQDEVVTVALAEYQANRDLPGALPGNTLYTYALTIEATATSKTSKGKDGKPISRKLTAVDVPDNFILRVKNTLGLPIGFIVPVGTWNPKTLQWDTRFAENGKPVFGIVVEDNDNPKGKMQGGSSIAFPLPPGVHDCNVPVQPPPGAGAPQPDDPEGGQGGGGGGEKGECNSPYKGLRLGNLRHSYELPHIKSFGGNRTVRLAYDSLTVNPFRTVTIPLRFDISRQALPDRMSVDLRFAGENYSPIEYSITDENSLYRVTYPMRMTGMPGSGFYHLRSMLAFEYRAEYYAAFDDAFGMDPDFSRPAGVLAPDPREFSTEQIVPIAVENRIHSQYGAGWWLEGVERIVRTPEGHALVIGGGIPLLFKYDSASETFASPVADTSTMAMMSDGHYRRVHRNGFEQVYNPAGRLKQAENTNGLATVYEYDGSGRLTRITYPGDIVTTLEYFSQGFRIIDGAGRTFTGLVDSTGDLISLADPDGIRVFEYSSSVVQSPMHLLTAVTQPHGARYEWIYDEAGRVTKEIDPLGLVTYIQSENSVGDVMAEMLTSTRSEDRQGIHTALAQESSKAAVRGPVGNGITSHTWSRSDDEGTGWMSYESRDILSRTTREIRDASDQVRKIVKPNGSSTSFEYDDQGNVTVIRDDPTGGETHHEYSTQLNRLIRSTDPVGNVTAREYDERGNPRFLVDALGNQTHYEYDEFGLLRRVVDAAGNETQYTYDNRGLLESTTSPLGNTTTFAYDDRGNVIQRTDALGRTTRFEYDQMDRLLEVTDTAGNSIEYTYTRPDCGCATSPNITSVTDARGHATYFDYDAKDRLIRITDPLGNAETFEYDIYGNRVARTDRSGRTIRFGYDAVNRMVRKILPNGEVVQYDYDVNDNLVRASNDVSMIGYSYDAAGRMTDAWQRWAPQQFGSQALPLAHSQTSEYDLNGNRVTMQSREDDISYGYDALNRLSSLFSGKAGEFSFEYDALSRRSRLRRPNGVSTLYAYDANRQITEISHQKDDSLLLAYNYMRDPVGNVVKRRILNDETESEFDYEYNERDWLTSESALPDWENQDESTAAFDELNRIVEDREYIYEWDMDGNLASKMHKTSGQTTRFEFGAENVLLGVAHFESPDSAGPLMEVVYQYDPLGRRVAKILNGVPEVYFYDGTDLTSVITSGYRTAEYYVHSDVIDEPLAMLRGDEMLFCSVDALGSFALATDQDGSVVSEALYSAFGEWTTDMPGQFGYTSREMDLETGLMYYRARMFDSSLGAFLSPDPIRITGKPPWDYAYVSNNPLRFVDPLGLEVCERPGEEDPMVELSRRFHENALRKAQAGTLDPFSPSSLLGHMVRPEVQAGLRLLEFTLRYEFHLAMEPIMWALGQPGPLGPVFAESWLLDSGFGSGGFLTNGMRGALK